jgi:glycosyltransferase involved in cell wall biosynthesis
VKIVSVMTTTSRGGAEFAAAELLDALARRGHDVLMLSDHRESTRGDMGRPTAVRLRPIALGPELSVRSVAGIVVRVPQLLRRLHRALDDQAPYDVLVLHYKKEQLLGSLLPRRLRATLVWAEWGPLPAPMRRWLPRRVYAAAARRAAAIMAVSEGTRASLLAAGVPADLVTCVPNALRPDLIDFTAEGRSRARERLDIPDEAFVVGCISRMHVKKRNDVVVQAASRLGDPRVHLVMAGTGETEDQLRVLAAPLHGRAHFLPALADDLAEVLSAFDVSVFCPSPTEGQPRAVIMAMLARRPCLSTAGEGVLDLIRPGCGTVVRPEHDPDALVGELRAYRDDADRRAREGESGRRLAEHAFCAPLVAEQVEELLRHAGDRRD